jgi:hypothetical protein
LLHNRMRCKRKKKRNVACFVFLHYRVSWAGGTVKCSFDVTSSSSVPTPFLISCKISLFPLMVLVSSPLSWALCYENKIVSEMCSSASPLRWRLLLCSIFIATQCKHCVRARRTGNCSSHNELDVLQSKRWKHLGKIQPRGN